MPRSSRPDRNDPGACERQAVGLLARREHSRFELARKLSARDYPRALIDETLDRLEQQGLLSGERFTISFIESRAARGVGPDRIRAELGQRGIDAGDAERLLAELDHDWRRAAREARVKRFGADLPPTYEERARQMRFLQSRGFSSAQIHAALEVDADSD